MLQQRVVPSALRQSGGWDWKGFSVVLRNVVRAGADGGHRALDHGAHVWRLRQRAVDFYQ
jgi:hypothetical protein